MNRSKKIFAAFALAFSLFLIYVAYDISNRTTFPGRQSEKEDPKVHAPSRTDSVAADSL